jgi:hypothetical protein
MNRDEDEQVAQNKAQNKILKEQCQEKKSLA